MLPLTDIGPISVSIGNKHYTEDWVLTSTHWHWHRPSSHHTGVIGHLCCSLRIVARLGIEPRIPGYTRYSTTSLRGINLPCIPLSLDIVNSGTTCQSLPPMESSNIWVNNTKSHQQNLTLLATTCQCLDETCSLPQVICKENPCKPGKLGQFLIDGLQVPCNELATSMITLSLAHHMPLWLAIAIYVPTQLPCGLWQVIWYSLVGLEKIFCLACLIWTYNRIGKAPASHCK